jgi:hypothetical protein
MPSRPSDWTLYLVYGGDVREGQLPWLRTQVAEIAGLPPIDDDGDRPRGMFVITDERGKTAMWQVQNGTIDELAEPSLWRVSAIKWCSVADCTDIG